MSDQPTANEKLESLRDLIDFLLERAEECGASDALCEKLSAAKKQAGDDIGLLESA